jgi:hypothetical protein
MMFKEIGHHYKPDKNKFCDECNVEVGDCVEYASKIRCIGCWVEFDANMRPRTIHDLINVLKKAFEEPYETSKVIISYYDAECILNKLEEIEYTKVQEQERKIEKYEDEWYVVKKSFKGEVFFSANTVWPERVFSKFGFDVQELLNDGYIEPFPAKKDY